MSKAIFLGTFDPPHKGHYNCIKSVVESGILEKLGIDKIHIIPTLQNPNKQKSTGFIHREKMCKLMFKDLIDNKIVIIDDVECDIEHTYTYELLDYFHSNKDDYIKDDFWWIITIETLEEIINNQWVNSENILKSNKFIVVQMPNDDKNYVEQLIKSCNYSRIIKLNPKYNYLYHSSYIRKMYQEGFIKVLDHTNPQVKKYIIDNNLYIE